MLYANTIPDNCPTVANRDQADANGNGVGDACEHNLTLPMYAVWDARLDALAVVFGDRFAPRQVGPWGPWDPLSPCPKCAGEALAAYEQALGAAKGFVRENDALFPAERVIQFLDLWTDTDRALAISHLNRRFGEGW